MIFTDRTIIVQKGISSINETIVLYRGDRDIEIRFTLNEGSPFKFGSGASPNIIEKTEAAYGQLVIKCPGDLPAIFSEIVPTNEGKIIFTITAEMIDEITEVGNYTFQIRLLDENRESRVTLPEVIDGIEIREPIAIEDITTTDEVDVAAVGYAVLTTRSDAVNAFDEEGNYIETDWATGDKITASKLDKIEQGITGVNQKIQAIPPAPDMSFLLTTEYRNICNTTYEDGSIASTTGLLVNDSNYCRMKGFVEVVGGKEIVFVKGCSININNQDVFEFDENYNFIKFTPGIYNHDYTDKTHTLVLQEATKYIKTRAWLQGTTNEANLVFAVYYTDANITVYEPYTPPKTTIKNEYIPDGEFKPVIAFDFDLTALDKRYTILQKYGYTATWQVSTGAINSNKAMFKKLIQTGHDLSPYTGLTNEEYKDTENHEANITKLAGQIDTLLNEMKSIGVYNPVMFSCTGHKAGYVVEEAVKQFPFHYVRAAIGVDELGTDYYVNSKSEPSAFEQCPLALNLYPTFAQVKEAIDTRIAKKYPLIMPMCHTMEFDKLTEDQYFENLVAYVKQLENAGTVEVMNMRDYYEKYYPIQARRDDLTRIMSAINDIKDPSSV